VTNINLIINSVTVRVYDSVLANKYLLTFRKNPLSPSPIFILDFFQPEYEGSSIHLNVTKFRLNRAKKKSNTVFPKVSIYVPFDTAKSQIRQRSRVKGCLTPEDETENLSRKSGTLTACLRCEKSQKSEDINLYMYSLNAYYIFDPSLCVCVL
jgi:hypothetical protein